MYRKCLAAIGLGLLAARLAVAEAPSPGVSPAAQLPLSLDGAFAGPAAPEPATPAKLPPAPPSPDAAPAKPCCIPPQDCSCVPAEPCRDCSNHRSPHFWFNADYLLWWVKGAPIPIPLVTTGSPTDRIPGGVGQPGTSVLIGNQTVDYGATSGLRFNAGLWLDAEERFGVDAGYFVLERRAQSFHAAANGAGDPVLAVPAFDVQTPGGEIAETLSMHDPVFGPLYTGSAAVATTLRLQGYDVNAAFNVVRDSQFRLALLAGYRSLSLDEGLTLQTMTTALAPQILSFNGAFFDPPGAIATLDSFHTGNKFYGGQVGGRFDGSFGRLTLDVYGKLALGATQSLTTINGASTFLLPGAPAVAAPGGIFALPTNRGRHFDAAFSVVSEAGLNVGVRLTSYLQASVGYSFLYWNNVERPGNQIDRGVNPQFIPTDQGFGQGGGPNRPAFVAQRSDFWAQGLTFGLELQF